MGGRAWHKTIDEEMGRIDMVVNQQSEEKNRKGLKPNITKKN